MKIKITPQQLNGTIEAIPSKSHAHRLLIAQKLASLQGCGQEIPLVIPTFSEDIDATKGCLAQLDQKHPCFDCRESGSTIRFMIPVAMALKRRSRLHRIRETSTATAFSLERRNGAARLQI